MVELNVDPAILVIFHYSLVHTTGNWRQGGFTIIFNIEIFANKLFRQADRVPAQY